MDITIVSRDSLDEKIEYLLTHQSVEPNLFLIIGMLLRLFYKYPLHISFVFPFIIFGDEQTLTREFSRVISELSFKESL
jgi:uncharacterized membrane protein